MNAPTLADDWRLAPFRLSNYTDMIRAGWTGERCAARRLLDMVQARM